MTRKTALWTAPSGPRRDDLKGWAEIAIFLGQPVAVAQRWARSGMPVRRSGRHVAASVRELSTWLGRQSSLNEPVHIATDNQDLSPYLERGLRQVRRHRSSRRPRRAA